MPEPKGGLELVPQYPPLPSGIFWFLTATRLSVPDEPVSKPTPTSEGDEQPVKAPVPSTATSTMLTLLACTSACTATTWNELAK